MSTINPNSNPLLNPDVNVSPVLHSHSRSHLCHHGLVHDAAVRCEESGEHDADGQVHSFCASMDTIPMFQYKKSINGRYEALELSLLHINIHCNTGLM